MPILVINGYQGSDYVSRSFFVFTLLQHFIPQVLILDRTFHSFTQTPEVHYFTKGQITTQINECGLIASFAPPAPTLSALDVISAACTPCTTNTEH